jgi:thiol-disulfide isomerase/thioredoxin
MTAARPAFVLLSSIIFSLSATRILAADPATIPSTQPDAAAASASAPTAQDLLNDLQTAGGEFSTLTGGSPDTLDPAHRAAIAPKVIPLLKRVDGDFAQIARLQPEAAQAVETQRVSVQALLILFGDAATQASLTQTAAGSSADAPAAQSALLVAGWWNARGDAAAQQKLVDTYKTLAEKYPNDAAVTVVALAMLGESAGPDIESQIDKIIINDLKTPEAQQIAQQLIEQETLRTTYENKPLTVAGTTLDGKPFTTADWKGKVILVEFWATWCGPCMAEMPRIIKTYSDYHAKGLEIVGVNNDFSADDLKNFLSQHPDVAWPQLFDAASAAQQNWNSITLGYGIHGIPQMFLIDKKGIVRTTDARQNLEDMLPKLLAE